VTTDIQQVYESDKAKGADSAALISPSESVSARNRNGSWPFGFPDENRPKRQQDAAAVQPAPLGYMCHSSPQKPRLVSAVAIYPHGIEVGSSFKSKAKRHNHTPVRGEINGFSAKARNRMLWTARTTDFAGFMAFLFLTLTYHDNWQGRDYQRDRDNFIKRLKRRYPDAVYLWRLEPQRRGAPHFHILVMLPHAADKDAISKDLPAQWHSLVDKGNIHHKKHGAKAVCLDSGYKGVCMYLSKYSAKIDASGASKTLKGKQWGKSKDWPSKPNMQVELDDKAEAQLRRFLRALLKARRNRSSLYANTIVQGHTSKVWLDKESEVLAVCRYVGTLKRE